MISPWQILRPTRMVEIEPVARRATGVGLLQGAQNLTMKRAKQNKNTVMSKYYLDN